MTKECRDCHAAKPISAFYTKGVGAKGQTLYQSYCRPCADARRKRRTASPYSADVQARYYQKNQERLREKAKAFREANPDYEKWRHIKRKYGLTRPDFEKMLGEQDHRCAICGLSFDEVSKVCVDHDHQTGTVRGLLCDLCNKGIGALRDDASVVLRAWTYLTKEKH